MFEKQMLTSYLMFKVKFKETTVRESKVQYKHVLNGAKVVSATHSNRLQLFDLLT